MKERLEEEYKFKVQRLKTSLKYKSEHTGLPNDKQIVPMSYGDIAGEQCLRRR